MAIVLGLRTTALLGLCSIGLLTTAACSDDGGGGGAGGSGSPTSSSSSSSGPGPNGSGGAGGGGGAGTAGGGQGGNAPGCGALFCDDFESYAAQGVPGGSWTPYTATGGEVTVDTTRFFSGGKSVKVSTGTGNYKSAMIHFSDPAVLPTANKAVYGRAMFYMEGFPQQLVNWTIIDGQGTVESLGYDAVYRYGGQYPVQEGGMFLGSQLKAGYETPGAYETPPTAPNTDCWKHSNKKVIPAGQWVCAEWKFDTANNQMQFWLNGEEISDLTVSGTGEGCVGQPDPNFEWTAPTFTRIGVGWESYQSDEPRTVWVDDFALGSEKIGCPPAQ